MSIEIRKKCPICNETNGTVLFKRSFDGMQDILPFMSYNVKQCSNCGMIYASDIVQNRGMDEYYEQLSKYDNSFYAFENEDYYIGIEKMLSAHTSKDVSLLDIGCGNGKLLKLLKGKGYKCLMGLEPSKNNCQYIENNYNVKVINGFIGNTIPELEGKVFDCIVMTGVLEHIMPLREMVTICLQYLSDDGVLFLDVPDVETFYATPDLYQQFSVEHINFFSIHSLANLMGLFHLSLLDFSQNGGVLSSIWCRERNGGLTEIKFDDTSAIAIQKYFISAQEVVNLIKNKLKKYRNNKIYLWGGGTHTAMLYQLNLLDGITIEGIIDSNRNYKGKEMFGHIISSPNEIVESRYPILISSQYAQESIEKSLRNLGLKNEVIKIY